MLLAGCATQAPTPAPERSWTAQRKPVAGLREWVLEGKVALRWEDDAQSARFRFEQSPDAAAERSELTLYGPLGAGAVRIVRERGALQVSRDGQTQQFPGDSQAAMERATGWPVPAAALGWWLRSLPAPGIPTDEWQFEAGWPTLLIQDGWEIRFEAWQEAGGLRLPLRMRLTHPARGIQARLIASRWHVPQAMRDARVSGDAAFAAWTPAVPAR